MMEYGYNKIAYDHCISWNIFYMMISVILLLYVDDMLIVDHDKSRIDKLKKELSKTFSMKDLGHVK